MKAYDITQLIAELKSDNVQKQTLLCCLFSLADLVVPFIVMPHTHSKVNTVF